MISELTERTVCHTCNRITFVHFMSIVNKLDNSFILSNSLLLFVDLSMFVTIILSRN